GPASSDLLVRVDGDVTTFVQRLTQAGLRVDTNPADATGALGEFLVYFDGDRTYDIIRDTAADLGIALRSLRTRSRSLEDLYLGNVTDGAIAEPATVIAEAGRG